MIPGGFGRGGAYPCCDHCAAAPGTIGTHSEPCPEQDCAGAVAAVSA